MKTTIPRRTLRFDSIDQALEDIYRLAAAGSEGKLHSSGRWSLGQSLNHLATWINYAYEGFPIKIPFFLRWLGPFIKKRALSKAMKPGIRIPGIPGGTLAIEDVPTAEALPRLRRSFARLSSQAPTAPHPIFGPLSQQEWIAMHLRHAELHLSFLSAEV